MFQTASYIKARTKKGQPNRFQYLQSLVSEYQQLGAQQESTSASILAKKRRILARLANFAYDPINYDVLWQLNVIDIFLDATTEQDEKLVEYGMSGICNYCTDPQVCRYVLTGDGLAAILVGLQPDVPVETHLSCITSLWFLYQTANALGFTQEAQALLEPSTLNCIKRASESDNPRIRNIGHIVYETFSQKQTV